MGLGNFGFIADNFVKSVREIFLKDYYQQYKDEDCYDQEDIDQVINEDWMIKRFLILAYKNEIDAAAKLHEALKWRKSTNIRHIKDNYFPEEYYKLGGLFMYEKDKQGLPMLIMRVRMFKRAPEMVEDVKRFLDHKIFEIDELTRGGGWMLLMDFTDCGYSHYESVDILHYFVTTLHYYFPAGMDYVLCLDLPWVLRTFWNVVKYWIPEKRRDMVKFATRENLMDYCDETSLPKTLGGNCEKPFKIPPPNCPSALEFGLGTLGLDRHRIDEIVAAHQPMLDEARDEL